MSDKREFVMLMHTLKKDWGLAKLKGGWFVSEKFDGQRCFWDGGVTRGMYKDDVPWANVQKDERYKERQVATGLWSRYGNVLHAPGWWLDELPETMLDGELWTGHNTFQHCRSTVSRLPGDDDTWSDVVYKVFDVPSEMMFCLEGRINNPNWKQFVFPGAAARRLIGRTPVYTAEDAYMELVKLSLSSKSAVVQPVGQWPLDVEPWDMLAAAPEHIEGYILRKMDDIWTPYRSRNCLKVVAEEKGRCKVTGYVEGKGQHEGALGAVWCTGVGEFPDRFKVNIRGDRWRDEVHWPIGMEFGFRYMSVTEDGKPRNPRMERRDR